MNITNKLLVPALSRQFRRWLAKHDGKVRHPSSVINRKTSLFGYVVNPRGKKYPFSSARQNARYARLGRGGAP